MIFYLIDYLNIYLYIYNSDGARLQYTCVLLKVNTGYAKVTSAIK